MRARWLLVACSPLLAGAAIAGDSFKDVQYMSGKAGFAKKVSGVLTIDETAVSFADEKGKPLFSIPMSEIDTSFAGMHQEAGSFGRKMALGVFASHTDEHLQINSHSATAAEGVVFKVKKNAGAGMATKIIFWSGKARAAAAAPPATAPPPAAPPPVTASEKPAEPPPID
jgi:hypothetical protein